MRGLIRPLIAGAPVGGAAGLTISATTVPAGQAGASVQLTTSLAGATFSLVSGANVTVSAAGVVAVTTGLAAGATRAFVARAATAAGDAIEAPFVLTGAALAAVPANTTAPSITGATTQGETLTCAPGAWSGFPAPTFTFQWRRGGSDVSGATAATYALGAADVGANISCRVTGTNASGSASATSAAVGPVQTAGAAPVNTVAPVVTGTATQGETLNCAPGTWTGTPAPTFAYQWRRGSADIAGATNASYALVGADVGATIACRVTATNASGSASATSAALGPVQAATAAPVNTAAPAITGTALVGQALACSMGTWTGTAPITYAYQWRRDGANIIGASAASYTLVGADAGATIACRVTATNTGGAASADAAGVGPVQAVALASVAGAPRARWSANHSALTTTGGRVTQVSDLQGNDPLLEQATGLGALLMTDALGRRFLRFIGNQLMDFRQTVLDRQNFAAWFVMRSHRNQSATMLGIGNQNNATNNSGSAGALRLATVSGVNHHLRAGSTGDTTEATQIGSQLQVVGVTSRPTAGGGVRLYVNTAPVYTAGAQIGTSVSALGGEIGRWAGASPTLSGLLLADVYEIVIYNAGQTNAEADATAAALVAAYGIQPIANTLVIEGASTMQGDFGPERLTDNNSGQCLGMQFTDPGGPYALPAGWRVITRAVAGNGLASLVTRRDAVGSTTQLRPATGKAIILCLVGYNDTGVLTNAQYRDNYAALLNTATTGWLQTGWRCFVAAPLAAGNATVMGQINGFRAEIQAASWLGLCNAAPGQAYAGQVTVWRPEDFTDPAAPTVFPFRQSADITSFYYQSDFVHTRAQTGGAVYARRLRDLIDTAVTA